jgi:hypothetical protein
MPMGPNAPQIVNGLADWIRSAPSRGSPGIVDELGTFVYAQTNPSPRAHGRLQRRPRDDARDRVEMFRQFGKFPTKNRGRARSASTKHPSRSVTCPA